LQARARAAFDALQDPQVEASGLAIALLDRVTNPLTP
jgi:hypothetical protein